MVGLGALEAYNSLNWQRNEKPVKACFCVGGTNCCIKVAERNKEAAIRADERRKVQEELNGTDNSVG